MGEGAFLLVATAWGTRHGGVNAFNREFAIGLAEALGEPGRVICAVPWADHDETVEAEARGVTLVAFNQNDLSAQPLESDSWSKIIKHPRVSEHNISDIIVHDLMSGRIFEGCTSVEKYQWHVFLHADRRIYTKHVSGDATKELLAERDLKELLGRADTVFGVGPLLAQSAREMLGGGAKVVEVLPGYIADNTAPKPTPGFHAVSVGRFGGPFDRIKQGRLAVMAWAEAVSQNRGVPLMQEAVNKASFTAFGYGGDDDDLTEQGEIDREVAAILGPHGAQVRLLPFLEPKPGAPNVVREQMREATIVMMPSWHDGFGLAGWDAVCLGVPLLLSRRNGLAEYIDRITGGRLSEYVMCVDLEGTHFTSGGVSYTPRDLQSVVAQLSHFIGTMDHWREKASELRALVRKQGNSWKEAGETFLRRVHAVSTSHGMSADTPGDLSRKVTTKSTDASPRHAFDGDIAGVESASPPHPATSETIGAVAALGDLWSAALAGITPLHVDDVLNALEAANPGYAACPLTHLQREALQSSAEVFRGTCNVLIAGPTSSGKTTLAELMMVRTTLAQPAAPCVLYIAPTRALAQEKWRGLSRVFTNSETFRDISSDVILSTGEDNEQDHRLRRGDFRIACLVYEKANVLLATNPMLRRRLGLVVIDELHMLADPERGPLLETFVVKLVSEKISRQRRYQRDEARRRALRIAGITTQGFDSQLLSHFLDDTDPRTGSSLPSIIVSSQERPCPISHHLLMPPSDADNVTAAVVPLLIKRIEPSGSPILSPHELREIETANFNARRRDNPYGLGRGSELDRFRLVDFLTDWFRDNPRGRRILVFVPAKADVDELAPQLKNKKAKLQLDYLGEHDEKTLELELRELDEADSMTSLFAGARAGVFVHHSDVARGLRRVVETICAERPHLDDPSQIILATETLSFGVNLSIDDVVLYGYSFPSLLRKRDGVERIPLTSCEYHNMLGRAGRLNADDVTRESNAFVFVRQSFNESPAEVLSRYYASVEPIEGALFSNHDSMEVVDYRESCKSLASHEPVQHTASPPRAVDFSYPFVRAVLDAVRYVAEEDSGSTDSSALISKFFRRSLHYAAIENELSARVIFQDAVRYVIDDCASQDLGLLDTRSDKTVLLSRLGESVIDTGTEIETILPLRHAVRILIRCWREHFGETRIPADLCIIPLILQTESHRQFFGELPELKEGERYMSSIKINNARHVIKRLGQAVLVVAPELDANSIRDFLTSLRAELGDSDWRPQAGERYEFAAIDACFRLATAVLGWVSGFPKAEIHAGLRSMPPPEKPITSGRDINIEALSERLSWKVLFLRWELFSSLWSPADRLWPESALYKLIQRLRSGCREEAIPLLIRSASEQQLVKRSAAHKLLRDGITPARILTAANPSPGIPADIDSTTLKRRLTTYACRQLEGLAKEFQVGESESVGRDRSRRVWQALSAAFQKTAEAHANSERIALNIAEEIWSEIAASYADERIDPITITLWPSGRMSAMGNRIDLSHDPASSSLLMTVRQVVPGDDDEAPTVHETYLRFVMLPCSKTWGSLSSGSGASIVGQLEKIAREGEWLTFVPFPWLPDRDELDAAALEQLHQLSTRGAGAAVMTPAAFGIFIAAIAREFVSDPMRLLQSVFDGTGLSVIGASDLFESLEGFIDSKFPAAIRERIGQHFEVIGRV